MTRPVRVCRPETEGLEGRRLLTGHAAPPVAPPSQVGFLASAPDGSVQVSQQAATATVSLWRSDVRSTLVVRVATLPSPAVGVNVGAVDQTVTFGPGQKQATVLVPIRAGAPNVREVDTRLTLTPINAPANLVITGPLELRIMASPDLISPTIIAGRRSRQGIELMFSKPMDPTRVTQVQNYFLHGTTSQSSDTKSILAAVFLGKWQGIGTTTYSGPIRLRAATYDPTRQTVTLIPARPIDPSAELTVAAGSQVKTRARPRPREKPALPLIDLTGNLISSPMGPGQFLFPIAPLRVG